MACCVTNSYKLTEDAERDVIDIYLYSIENFGPVQADKYVTGLFERFALIAGNPASGKDFGEVHPDMRRWFEGSHAIYYEPLQSGILILRILHQQMDPARHLV